MNVLRSSVTLREVLAIALFCLSMFAPNAHAGDVLPGQYGGGIEGIVVGVTDGDTATVQDDSGSLHEIRLFAIDAPETSCHGERPSAWDDACVERDQPYGKEAKKSLVAMIYGKRVNVELQTGNSYGRQVGTIWVDNLNVNLEQVRRGYAMMYRQYAKRGMLPDDYREMELAEQSAKDRHLGLWNDPHPLEPWEYRHHGGGYHGG